MQIEDDAQGFQNVQPVLCLPLIDVCILCNLRNVQHLRAAGGNGSHEAQKFQRMFMLAYHNIGKIGEVVDRPKALGDIRGVSYIYGMFYRFGLIDVPDKVKEKMGVKEH